MAGVEINGFEDRATTPSRAADVVVVGGGVAGCATALMLRRHAPHLRIVVLEAGAYEGPQLGESLPPLALQLLKQLGLGQALPSLIAEGIARPSHGVEILWGSSKPAFEDYLLRTRGSGFHLDRARFGAWLARACEARDIELRRGVRVRHVEPDRDGGRLRLCIQTQQADEQSGFVSAAVVIDAAGRTAPVATRLGARITVQDSLVALARFFGPGTGSEDPRLTVESFAHGWWYAAGLPGDRLVAVALTDTDLMRELDLRTLEGWTDHLPARVAARIGECRQQQGPPIIRSASCGGLDRASGIAEGGAGWLAVGDAASTFDPLSSQGMCKALRSGIFAAYAASDFLSGRGRDDPEQRPVEPIGRYTRFVRDEFRAFLAKRSEVYDTERRWPESLFWRRRRSPAPAEVSISTLDATRAETEVRSMSSPISS